jgi:hypothetical protein
MFDMVKQQDSTMHSISAELGVKTSLYLVFAVFELNASIQLLNFAKDFKASSASYAILLCSFGAVVALIAGAALLTAALVRNYSVFPARDMASWLAQIRDYQKENPQNEVDPLKGLLETMIQTVDANQAINERKARWIDVGSWCLFASLFFFAIGAGFAIRAYFVIHPF